MLNFWIDSLAKDYARLWKRYNISLLLVQLSLLISLFLFVGVYGLEDRSMTCVIRVTLDVFSLIVLTIMFASNMRLFVNSWGAKFGIM